MKKRFGKVRPKNTAGDTTLWEILLPLHQALSPISHNHALFYLRGENVKAIDSFKGDISANRFVKYRKCELSKFVAACLDDLDNVKRFVELKERFSELLMFTKLARRYPTQAIPESKTPTPDFFLAFRRRNIFVEMKSLNMLNTEANLRGILNASLESKIVVERQIREEGKRVAWSMFTIQPYRTGPGYDPDSTTTVVEGLIEKVDQNIDPEQFNHGPTILLVDLSDQLLLHGPGTANLEREFILEYLPQSGELWHFAFGSVDMPMRRVPDWLGENNEDHPLTRNGILRKHDFIAGLVVHYLNEFWGLAVAARKNIGVIDFLRDFCERVVVARI